ncbi:hypothetical protein ABEP00_19785 [Heyndrickxia sporothermodurans]|uniref:hypothetical protein n=1 Tax=Heyndrickxia sporothermodurans TaxID=46224 RepID=UPI003D247E02
MIIEVVSYISPIQTTSQHNKEVILQNETVEVVSSINSIVTSAEVPKKQTIEVESYVSTINATIIRSGNEIQNVTISLSSFVSHIQAHTDVLIPLNNNVVNAYTSVIYNPSMATYSENISQLDVINNPSFVEVN